MNKPITKYNMRKGKLSLTINRWQKLRDAVKRGIYKIYDDYNKDKFSNTIYDANIREIDTKYASCIQYDSGITPLTQAIVVSMKNLGNPINVATVEGNINRSLLPRIAGIIRREISLPILLEGHHRQLPQIPIKRYVYI